MYVYMYMYALYTVRGYIMNWGGECVRVSKEACYMPGSK